MKRGTSKMWAGRLPGGTDGAVERFTRSLPFDRRLYAYDIEGSLAHVEGLVAAKVLTRAEAERIAKGLKAVRAAIAAERVQWLPGDEDIHMAVERLLGERIGPLAGKLHTGRSRNDQVALDLRLYLRAETGRLTAALDRMQRALVAQAKKQLDVVLPGYTHLQRAQPVLLSHHLLAYYEMVQRDRDRLHDGRARIDVLPLGSGALAGTGYAVPRERIAERLGFAAVSRNSLDAVGDRDCVIEFITAAAVIMMHLSRMSEEVILWATDEFGFIELPDAYCTGSSLMPQKKNPDVPELIRAKTGRVYGHLMALLTVMKGLPLAYNRDLQEDKEALFDAADTTHDCVEMAAGLIAGIQVQAEAMDRAARSGFLSATDLADHLVRRGMPFRAAHGVVGAVVRHCLERRQPLTAMTLAQLLRFSKKFGPDVLADLTLETVLARRNQTGGTARAQVARQIQEIEDRWRAAD